MQVAHKITIIVLVITAMSGCTTFDSGKKEYIEAREVDEVPQDAPVISYENESIKDSEAIQKVINKAVNASGGSVRMEVSSAEAEEAREALKPLPVYEGDPAGYYVRKGNQTFVITFLKQQ